MTQPAPPTPYNERLVSLLKNASKERPAAEAAKKVETTFAAFSLILKGELMLTIGSLGYAAVGAVLGTFPGAEFLAAVEGAQRRGGGVVMMVFWKTTLVIIRFDATHHGRVRLPAHERVIKREPTK